MTKPVVISVMPNRGSVLPESARAFYAQPSRGGLLVSANMLSMSILELTFNRLWIDALNERAELKPRYFAMLHDDVCPDPYWLDTLVAELEKHDADIVSAIVPLKDHYGLTSTAVGDPDDIWSMNTRRLSITEALSLPTTFSREDIDWPACGPALLVNSGCWVCRFDSPWVEEICWRMESRNVNTQGTWTTQCMSEDWLFGFDAYRLGLKVMSTTAVKLHHGKEWCHNRAPWGAWRKDELWQVNAGYTKSSAQAKATADLLCDGQWKFPAEVDGWLLFDEGVSLAKAAEGKRVLEIGSYCGRSTICMAQTAESIVAVDPHQGVTGNVTPRDTYDDFHANLARYGIENVTVERMTSKEFADTPAREPFDFVFIDGAHDYESVKLDIELAINSLSDDGLIAFHDYRTGPRECHLRWDEGVQRAVSELLADGGELIDHRGTVAFVRPPARIAEEQHELRPACSY